MSLNDFIAGLERRKLPFFHFTDSKNLALIRRHGLLSMRRLRRACIHVPAPGGNQWSQDADRIYGVDTFVHLSFMDGNPMIFYAMNEGRITDLKYLRIKPSVIRLPNTKITLDVSNKAGVVPRPAEELLANLDLEVMYTRTDWNDVD